ncbi:MAG: glycosyltransferase family 117 protein [Gemmatimonadales bacterium]
MTGAPREASAPPYRWAALTAAGVFVVYLLTLAPTTAFWDTSEYIAAAKVLGIPHPPGNPLFVMLAHAFGVLPLAASYAVRINLFAAVTSALSAFLWFLVAERWLRAIVADRGLRLAAAAAGVLVGAFSWTVWNQSTVNEKVYTLSMLSMALVTWLAVHWGDDRPGPHRDRWLILIAYVIALSSTNHLMGVLAGPAVAAYVLGTDRKILLRPWVVLMGWLLALGVSGKLGALAAMLRGGPPDTTAVIGGLGVVGLGIWALLEDRRNPLLYLGVLAVLVGLTPNYVFLPIRAAQFPPINEGEPVGFFSQALMDVLNRVQYGKPDLITRQADFFSQLGMYVQYFNWQFARDWTGLQRIATVLFAVCGLSGLVVLLRKDRRAGIAALLMFGTLTLLLVFYLNFRYGYSWPTRPGITTEMREVRERDYFFVGSFAFFGTLVAAGIGAWAQFLWTRARGGLRWLAAAPPLVLALVPLLSNRSTASRADEWIAHDFARDLLESVEPYAVLITAGDNDTFPLWFAQEVEGIRPDVTLANLSLMNTEWHLRQLRRRETPEFDPTRSIDLWKPRTDTSGISLGTAGPAGWPRPTTPVFALDIRELDSLPELSRVPKGQGIRFDSLLLAFGTEILERRDIATIFLIRDNLGKRPIYFSWSAGGYPDETFGLTPYLISQGLARKLSPNPLEPTANLVLSPMGFTDLERTRTLIEKEYRWQSAARRRPSGWIDPPSSSILRMYSIIYGGIAETLRDHGDSALAARADSITRRVDDEVRRGLRLHGGGGASESPPPPPSP